MNVEQPSSFEVRCQHCRVTFPVGTRTCVHCGQRIGRARVPRPGATRSSAAQGRPQATAPPPELEDLEEEEMPTRGGLMSPVAILWVVLILGGAIYRACG